MIFSKKSLTYMTMMLVVTSLANCVYARSEKKERRDPLVGSYAVNVPTLGFFGGYSFHEDGTVVWQDSGSIVQSIPPLFPSGAYGTIAVGKWKKVCKGSYTFVHASVINLKDITTRDACGDLLFAGIPFARLKVVGNIELSEDCQFITGAVTLNFFEVDDISLTIPVLVNGQPIPPINAQIIGQRIDFNDAN